MIKGVFLSMLASIGFCAPHLSHAAATCGGVLTDAQVNGLSKFFSVQPGPNLFGDGTGLSGLAHMVKKVSNNRLTQLQVSSPVVADSVELTAKQAADLKGWLNADAGASIPGWFSTAVGVFVPSAWVGVGVDLISQFLNASGDTGRMSAANVAGTVTADGQVAALEQIAKDGTGSLKYLFFYVYNANINGHPTVASIYWCTADVVTT